MSTELETFDQVATTADKAQVLLPEELDVAIAANQAYNESKVALIKLRAHRKIRCGHKKFRA